MAARARASQFDASIAAERSAITEGDAMDLVTQANAQLELVDAVEAVFESASEEDAPD